MLFAIARDWDYVAPDLAGRLGGVHTEVPKPENPQPSKLINFGNSAWVPAFAMG